MVQNTKDKMESLAILLQAHIQELPGGLQDDSVVPYVLKLGRQTGFRYTVIDVDGDVLADSAKGDQDIGWHLGSARSHSSRKKRNRFRPSF